MVAGPLDYSVSLSGLSSQLASWAVDAVEADGLQPLTDGIVNRCAMEVFAERLDDGRFMAALAASITENVRALKEVLCGRVPPAGTELSHRLRFAVVEAESWVSHASLEKSYRISFFLQWRHWSAVVSAAAAEHGIERSAELIALTDLASLVHQYTDSVMSSVAHNFAESEQALNRSRAHLRQRLVRDLLQGDGPILSPADLATLDYSLDVHHLALHLPGARQDVADRLLRTVRSTVHPIHVLLYPLSLDSSVIWLGSDRPWSREKTTRLTQVLCGQGAVAAVSDSVEGLRGFLRTFEQVIRVEELRQADTDLNLAGVTHHSDVRLEILLMQAPELARELVDLELGPLAQATTEAGRLRETLEASFAHGSHVATAEALGLHEHTVRNRLRKVHELLGQSVSRRIEIQVALRLFKSLERERSE